MKFNFYDLENLYLKSYPDFMVYKRGFIIGGTHSGCGKTTVTMGIIRALKDRRLNIQPWKSGPDYIDPGFHSLAAGVPCRNLDTMILSDSIVHEIFHRQRGELSVIEGVMGLFDGAGALDERGSAAHLSKLLKLPVILVIDAKAMARSAAAIALGFSQFDKDVPIAGFIMNRVGSESHYRILKESIEDRTGIPVLGRLPADEKIHIPERHLGLVQDINENDFDEIFHKLTEQVELNINLDAILELSENAGDQYNPEKILFSEKTKKQAYLKIAVARDEAFHFYYEDNLDILRHYGAEIVFFSPVHDVKLPDDISAIYVGGGYPELYAPQLEANSALKQEIFGLCEKGMPVYGECGGFMYLTEGIIDEEGSFYSMLNILPGKTVLGKKLRSLGYCQSRLQFDCILGKSGSKAKGHVFHWSELELDDQKSDESFVFQVEKGDQVIKEGFAYKNVVGSWVHHHFASNPEMAKSFIEAAESYCQN